MSYLQTLYTNIINHKYIGHFVSLKVFPFWLAFIVWLSTCIYFTNKDLNHDLSTKIQKGRLEIKEGVWRDTWATKEDIYNTARPQIIGHLVMLIISSYIFGKIKISETLPSFQEFSIQILINLIVADFGMYWMHRTMHRVPFLRKHIHSVHHTYKMNFAFAGGHVHPVEDLITIFIQMFMLEFVFNSHQITKSIYFMFWTIFLIEEHSGHNVWWSPYNLTKKIVGGAATHDSHHFLNNKKNYSFIFPIWDYIFNTYSLQAPPYAPIIEKQVS